jgi:phosphatidylglycerol:prolipoprotein diacylglycerol transferase
MEPPMPFFQPPVEFASLGLDPIALQVGAFALRWYSLAYIVGILAAWWMLARMLRLEPAPMNRQQLDDLITWSTLGVIAGGRLAYVIFYDPGRFLADPLAVVRLWEGGMAFHGGLVGVIVAVWLTCRARDLSTLRVLDYAAVVVPVGLFLGRMANFVNGELWGRETDGTWGVIFPDGGPNPRHPSQLYEAALEGVLLFIILNLLFWKTDARLRPGLLAGIFGLGYGLSRFLVEFVREPDVQLGILSTGLTMGQTLSLPLIIGGLWLIARALRAEPLKA